MSDNLLPIISTTEKGMITPTKKFKVRPGTIDSGKEYETKVASLLALRCCFEELQHFWVATNVDGFGALDDIIIYKKSNELDQGVTYLMQLKHQDASKILSKNMLLALKGDFSFKKYYKCYGEIQSKISDLNLKSDMLTHLRDNSDIVLIIFTNKSLLNEPVSTDQGFLRKVHETPQFDGIRCNGDIFNIAEPNMENLYLFTNQPPNKDMDEKINSVLAKNLAHKLQLSDVDLSDIVQKFVYFIGEWSSGALGGQYPLTKMNILKKLVELLLFPYMLKGKIGHKGEDSDDNVDEDIEVNQEENIWYHITKDKDVTVIDEADDIVQRYVSNVTNKIVCNQGIFNSITEINRKLLRVVRDSQNLSKCEKYELLWKIGKIPLLLEVSDAQGVQYIEEILKQFPRVFRVIILNKTNTQLRVFQNLKLFTDVSDLSTKQQECIFQKPIQLQGRKLSSLEKLNINKIECLKSFKVKDIIHILCGKFEIGRELEKLPKFFVEMSLTRMIIDINFLKEAANDISVVRCPETLSNNFQALLSNRLQINASEVIQWDQLNETKFDGRIITFSDKQNLEEIEEFCLTLTETVHFLAWDGEDYFELIKSNNINENLKKHKKTSIKPILAKELLRNLQHNKQALIISANPGTGKSVFMNYLALHIPIHLWVLNIRLAKYCDHYKKWDIQNDESQELHFEEFLNDVVKVQHTNNSDMFNVVFKQYLNRKHLVFLLDGLDEVPVNQQNGAKQLIKFINQSGYFLCVTTRPVLQYELELTLNTFAISLNTFTKDEQKLFLTNYFANIGNVIPSNKKVSFFVAQLLEASELNLNDMDYRFTGIPLQTTLLAEVFANDFMKYLRYGLFTKQLVFDLIYLYEHYIRKKIKTTLAQVENVYQYNMMDLYKSCRSLYALRHLFDAHDLEELQIDDKLQAINENIPHVIQLLQKDGIIEIDTGSNVSFVHQAYAEFLVANWLVENINTSHKEVVQNLIVKTFQPNFLTVRHMFDRILAKNCPLHTAIINNQLCNVQTLAALDKNAFGTTDAGGRTTLHLIAAWGLHHPDSIEDLSYKEIYDDVMMVLLNRIPKEKLRLVEDNLLNYTPLDYAILSRSLSIADRLALAINNPDCSIKITKEETDAIFTYVNTWYSASLYIVIMKCFITSEQTAIETNHLHTIVREGNLGNVRSIIFKNNVDTPDDDGCTPLHTAAKAGHKDIANFLLSRKANVNQLDEKGRSALHWASFSGNSEIISMLLNKEARVDAIDCYESTPLQYALHSSSSNQTDIVNLLIAKKKVTIGNWIKAIFHKSTQELDTISMNLEDKHHMNPIHLAAHLGQTVLENLLSPENADINTKGYKGMTALMFAAQNNQIDSVRLLLTHDANIETLDDSNRTALHYAIIEGHEDVVCILLSNAANIEASNSENEAPLHLAVQPDHQSIVTILLLNGADINARNYDNYAPIHLAALRGLQSIVIILLNNGANIAAKDSSNKTPLHLAASQGHQDVVNIFLANGAEINAEDSNNQTSLHLAAEKGHQDVVAILLTNGADAEIRNSENQTALHLAAERDCQDVVTILLSHGADIDARSPHNTTSLHLASFRDCQAVTKILLINGANIEAKNFDNKTSLHLAAEKGHQDIVTILLSNNSDIEERDFYNKTSLHFAAENGHQDVVTILLAHGADIEGRDSDNKSPLHYAAENGHCEVVTILLDNGADIEGRDSDNKCPLHFAAKEGRQDVVTILLVNGADFEARNSSNLTPLDLATSWGHQGVVTILLNSGENSEANVIANKEVEPDCSVN